MTEFELADCLNEFEFVRDVMPMSHLLTGMRGPLPDGLGPSIWVCSVCFNITWKRK
jgi:hypothetical protein